MASNESTKQAVIELIFKGAAWWPSGRSTVTNGKEKVHIRYCSPPTYKFNINPNTLRAHHELWICGNQHLWYLIPMIEIDRIYKDPLGYPDNRHPNIRVVSVYDNRDEVMYAKGAKTLDITSYRMRTLP